MTAADTARGEQLQRHWWNTDFRWDDHAGPFGFVVSDPSPKGEPTGSKPCNDPGRQYPVVRAGERLDPPPRPDR